MLINFDFNITITEIRSANRLYNGITEGEVRRDNRPRWALVLKHGGTTYYNCNGQRIRSDALHPVVLPKGCSYGWTCTEPGECLIIEFEAQQEHPYIIPFSVADSRFIVQDFLKIERCLHQGAAEAHLENMHLLYGLLLQLAKTTPKRYIPKEKQALLSPAVQYIAQQYFLSGITNDTLAQLCGISTVYFRKSFEAVYGLSPIRYLHDFRMRKAKDLLSSDYDSIGQVAESVGYNSVYHFSKMFRLYTGMSPTQYVAATRK